MNIPGSNLLTDALEVICRQSFQYYSYQSRIINEIGKNVRTYAPPVTITGIVQAVDRSLYSDSGLDFNKRYIQVWTDTDTGDLYRDRAGDQIQFNNARWEITSENDWFPVDNWNSFLAVEVPTL